VSNPILIHPIYLSSLSSSSIASYANWQQQPVAVVVDITEQPGRQALLIILVVVDSWMTTGSFDDDKRHFRKF
jgi:hypothetical protein